MANIFQTVPEIEGLTLKFEHPGRVPNYVSGDFFILGPGRFEWGDSKYRGFLDANALTSKITIRNGGDESENSVLKFDRKFVKSKTWEWNSEFNDIVISEFATYAEPKDLVPHPKKPLESMITRMEYFSDHISDNTIVKITEIYGQMIAFGEASGINVLDRDTLDTVAHVDIAKAKAWPEGAMMLTQTAHGYYDKETDAVLSGSTILNMANGIPVPAYAILKYTRASEKIELEEIRRNPEVIADRVEISELIYANEFNEEHGNHIQYNQYFHTSLVTEDFFILTLTNAALMPTTCAMTNTMQAKPIQDCYTVNKDLDGIIIVLDKRTLKEVGRFRIDYLIAFHEINVFQTESDKNVIHLDVMNMGETADPFSIFPLDVINATSTDYQEKYYATMPGTTPAKLVLDLNSEKDKFGIMTAERVLMMEDADDNNDWLTYMNAGSDFPKVRPSDWGKSTYDEFYSNGLGSISPDRIYKTKISTKERKVWHEIGYFNSEVAIIENPAVEGECVLMLLMTPFELTEATPRAFLVVLDGENLEEVDRAYFPENVRLPWMAHSTWSLVERMNEPGEPVEPVNPVDPVTDTPKTEVPSSTSGLVAVCSLIMCLLTL